MPTDGDFALSVLSEADLAEDPRPDQWLKLDVWCRDATAEGHPLERLSIRTTPRQMAAFFEQYRGVRYSIVQRAQRQAERDAAEDEHERAKARLLKEANGHLPADVSPTAHLELLERVRHGLEGRLGPVPDDSPPGENEP